MNDEFLEACITEWSPLEKEMLIQAIGKEQWLGPSKMTQGLVKKQLKRSLDYWKIFFTSLSSKRCVA